MKSKDYEILDPLVDALERLEFVLSEVKDKKNKTIYLLEVLTEISEAKKIATEQDKKLIENFENELKKLHEKKATKRNYKKLKHLFLHFAAEIYMAKVTVGYSAEEYNKFLNLLEIKGAKNYLFSVSEGKEGIIDETHLKTMRELGLLEKKDDKITLTKKGEFLVKALKTLQLLTKMREDASDKPKR